MTVIPSADGNKLYGKVAVLARLLKIVFISVAALAVACVAFMATVGKDLFYTATNSVSRTVCATVFVAKLDPDRMFKEEQLPGMRSIGWAIRYNIDRGTQQVITTVFGAFSARAVYRQGLGCTLVHDDGAVSDAAGYQAAPIVAAFAASDVITPSDPALQHALALAFAEPNPATPRLTKAMVVLHDGKLIAEQYAPGYGPHTLIWGHSLSKSVTNALIGILVGQGKLRLEQTAPIAGWTSPTDPRHVITVDQLLRMDSGLPFDETNALITPMSRMTFLSKNMAAYAASMPLAHPPGTNWAYSNLGYVLLSRIAMNAAGSHDAVSAERFIRSKLFAPLGMRDALIETDAAGTPIGSSQVYASARDFARFGQLYLDDGVVNGQRLLPTGWVAYSHSQTLHTGYGAGFWTNLVNEGRVPVWDAPWGMPQLPKDMYYARGALGQYIVIVPSERLVVVRLGITLDGSTGMGDVVAQIISALHRSPASS